MNDTSQCNQFEIYSSQIPGLLLPSFTLIVTLLSISYGSNYSVISEMQDVHNEGLLDYNKMVSGWLKEGKCDLNQHATIQAAFKQGSRLFACRLH